MACHSATASAISSAVPATAGRSVSSRNALALAASSVTRNRAWAERWISAGIAADALAVLVEHGAALGDRVGEAPHVPLVGVAGDDAEHPVALAADEERERVLHGLGLTDGVGELVVAAVERGGLLAEEAVPHLAGLLEAGQQLAGPREVDAVLLVLVDLPAGADAEQHAPVADVVDGGRPVRDDGGVPVGVAEHERAEADALGRGGERGQRAGALEGRHLDGTRARPSLPMKWSITYTPSHPVASAWRLTSSTSAHGWASVGHTENLMRASASTTWSMQRVRAATSSGSIDGNSAMRSWLRPSLR